MSLDRLSMLTTDTPQLSQSEQKAKNPEKKGSLSEKFCQDWMFVALLEGDLRSVKNVIQQMPTIFTAFREETQSDSFRSSKTAFKTALKNPLHFAAAHGHLDIVQFLLTEQEAKVNAPDEWSYTPLHYAAQRGQLHLVDFLVTEMKAKIDPLTKNFYTPLHLAASSGHLKVVEYLVEKKADINALTKDKFTARDVACSRGHTEIAGYLSSQNNIISMLLAAGEKPPEDASGSKQVISIKENLHALSLLDDKRAKVNQLRPMRTETVIHNKTAPVAGSIFSFLSAGFKMISDCLSSARSALLPLTPLLAEEEKKKIENEVSLSIKKKTEFRKR